MAILWPCRLSVEAYAAAGKEVVVPRQRCPACGSWMIFWSGYGRSVRAGRVLRIWVKRAHCKACGGSSHALLPSFCLLRRLDAVEVIGPAVAAVAAGVGTRSVARRMGDLFAHTTVRGWWRRHRQRAGWLLGLVAAVEGWCLPRSSGLAEVDAALALEAVGAAVSAAVGIALWPSVSLLSDGAWLSATTTTTPTTADVGWRLMTAMAARGSRIPP